MPTQKTLFSHYYASELYTFSDARGELSERRWRIVCVHHQIEPIIMPHKHISHNLYMERGGGEGELILSSVLKALCFCCTHRKLEWKLRLLLRLSRLPVACRVRPSPHPSPMRRWPQHNYTLHILYMVPGAAQRDRTCKLCERNDNDDGDDDDTERNMPEDVQDVRKTHHCTSFLTCNTNPASQARAVHGDALAYDDGALAFACVKFLLRSNVAAAPDNGIRDSHDFARYFARRYCCGAQAALPTESTESAQHRYI